MAFETGTATDVFDLLSKLQSFISLNTTWNENAFDGTDLFVDDGTTFWAFHATNDINGDTTSLRETNLNNQPGIACQAALGFDGGQPWDNQPNNSNGDAALGGFGNTNVEAYWFFTDGSTYVHIAAKTDPAGWYTLLSAGNVVKLGTWTGGGYIGATAARVDFGNGADGALFTNTPWQSGHIHADIDGATNAWQSIFDTPGTNLSCRAMAQETSSGTEDAYLALYRASPNDFNGRSVMLPLYVLLNRGGSPVRYSPAMSLPDGRVIVMDFIDPEASLTIGADEWLIFPILGRKDVSQSRNVGLAFKKIP